MLATFVDGCGPDHDRCYFSVESLNTQAGNLIIVATGIVKDVEGLIDKGETEWGYWVPRPGNPLCSLGNNSSGGSNKTTNGNGTTTDTFGDDTIRCVAPADTVYGLPTACFGEYFDKDLDDSLGYTEMLANSAFRHFVTTLAASDENEENVLSRRCFGMTSWPGSMRISSNQSKSSWRK